jgi:hypothetical protein
MSVSVILNKAGFPYARRRALRYVVAQKVAHHVIKWKHSCSHAGGVASANVDKRANKHAPYV